MDRWFDGLVNRYMATQSCLPLVLLYFYYHPVGMDSNRSNLLLESTLNSYFLNIMGPWLAPGSSQELKHLYERLVKAMNSVADATQTADGERRPGGVGTPYFRTNP